MRKYVWSTGTAAMMAAGLFFAEPFPTQAAEPMPAGVSVDGESLEGLTEAEAEEQVQSRVDEKLAREVALTIGEMSFAASSGDLGIAWKNEDQVRQALKDAEVKGNLIQRYMKKKDLEAEPVDLELEFSADPEKISAFVDAECKDAVREASDASITRENGEFVLTPSVVGTTVDPEATGAAIGEAVSQADGVSGTVSAAAVVTEKQPEITTEELSSIKDVLGTFSTSFKTSGASRSTNLQVGAAKINGRVLMPGEVLSGYECMQPFTVANGYRAATAYENGRSVDSIGGGVCQIATTAYMAVLYGDFEVTARRPHSTPSGYPNGLDATINTVTGYIDFKWKNNTESPCYVFTWIDTKNYTVNCSIYGQPFPETFDEIELSSTLVEPLEPGVPEYEVKNSLYSPYWMLKNKAVKGSIYESFKTYKLKGKVVETKSIGNTEYKMHPTRYYVWPGYAGEPLDPQYELKANEDGTLSLANPGAAASGTVEGAGTGGTGLAQ